MYVYTPYKLNCKRFPIQLRSILGLGTLPLQHSGRRLNSKSQGQGFDSCSGYREREISKTFRENGCENFTRNFVSNQLSPFEGAATISIMTLGIMTLSIMTLSIVTLSIMTLSIMTLSIMGLFTTLSTTVSSVVTLSVIRLSVITLSVAFFKLLY